MRAPIVVLTGAGLSTASGIPDYRGPQGMWQRFDPDAFHIERFHADPVGFWDDRVLLTRAMRILDAKPNDAHHILAQACHGDRVAGIVTQNIDGLHQRAGTPDDRLIEVHGNAALCRCLACDATIPTRDVVAQHTPGTAPRCACGAPWKPDVVLFGEIVTELGRAERLVQTAQTLITVGTSLQVYPVAGLVQTALRQGSDVVIINDAATPFDSVATKVQRGDVIDGLRALFPEQPERA